HSRRGRAAGAAPRDQADQGLEEASARVEEASRQHQGAARDEFFPRLTPPRPRRASSDEGWAKRSVPTRDLTGARFALPTLVLAQRIKMARSVRNGPVRVATRAGPPIDGSMPTGAP